MHASKKGREAPAAVELRPGLPAAEVQERLRRGLALRDAGQRILAFYLTEMEERCLHQLTGHSSTAFYAEARLELDRRRVAELIQVGRKLLELRAIDQAFCDGRIGWSKVLQLVKVAVPEHEEAWLARALELTCRELALEVRLSKAGSRPRAPGDRKGLPEIRFRVSASVGTLTHRKLELAKLKLAAERGSSVDDAELLDVLAELFLNLEEDGSVPGRTRVDASLYRVVLRSDEDADALLVDTHDGPVPLPATGGASVCCDAEHVRVDGSLDPKTTSSMRRKVIARDGAQCRACDSRHQLMVHHIVYRSKGGRTSPDNLITLCVSCHALVHDDLLVIEGSHASEARFVGMDGCSVDHAALEAGRRAHPKVTLAPREKEPTEVVRQPQPASKAAAFAGVLGQDALLDRLDKTATGCRARGKPFPHTLFMGPAGTGKTTLAVGVAARVGARLIQTCGPLLAKPQDMVSLLARLAPGDMLFIDEIHAVPRGALEMLYDAMTSNDRELTVLAATTDMGDLPHALLTRFGLQEQLDFFDVDTLMRIVAERAAREGLVLAPGAASLLARRARGTPREAVRLLEQVVNDHAANGEHAADGGARSVGRAVVARVLSQLGFDEAGLRPEERRYLKALRASRVPVPLRRLARQLGASARTLAEYIEPFLFREGLVRMTPQGRIADFRPRLAAAMR